MSARGSTTLGYQVKDMLKNQLVELKFISDHIFLTALKCGMVLILIFKIEIRIKNLIPFFQRTMCKYDVKLLSRLTSK